MANKVTISDDIEDAEHIVCLHVTSPLLMPDNVVEVCRQCFKAIQCRPNLPKGIKKICLACASPEIEAATAKGELDIRITTTSAAEVTAWLARKRTN